MNTEGRRGQLTVKTLFPRLFDWVSTMPRRKHVISNRSSNASRNHSGGHGHLLRAGLEPLEPRRLLTTFTEISVNLGAGSAAAWGDFNNDGWTDLYANYNDGTKDISSVVIRNDGGNFNMQQQLLSQGSPAGGGIWGDYDNDGYLDIFAHQNHHLFHNDGGTGFSDVSHLLPSLPMINTLGATWGDFNGDSYLDLYVAGYETPNYQPDAVLINNQGQGFTLTWQSSGAPARGVTAADFDHDNDLDIYVSNYRLVPNNLWENDGLGNFTDTAGPLNVAGDSSGSYPYGHTIGSAWGDLDNDGYLDLLVGNFRHAWGDGSQDHTKILRNRGPSHDYDFELKAELTGSDWQEAYASPALGDYDNDGNLDFYLTTAPGYGNTPRLYRNTGNWQFHNATSATALGGINSSYQNAWADYDNDGDLDLVAASRIYRNNTTGTNWLKLKLEGDGRRVSTTAIGAQVRAIFDDIVMTRQVEGGTGQGNQNDLTLHFGLGSYNGDVALEITWPDGTVRTTSVPSNATHTILLNEPPEAPIELGVSDLRTDGAMITWSPSSDLDGDRLSYELQYRKDDLTNSWSSSIEHSVPLKPLVVPAATIASTGPQSGLWGIENIIINQVNTFDLDQGTSGNPDNDEDPTNDTGLGLIGYTGGVRTRRAPVPSNSAGIPSSPLLYDFQEPSQNFYTGHVENKPNSLWMGTRREVMDQWIEIELNDVTELEQLWIWNWNDGPEVGRQVNSFDIQVSTSTNTAGQLGHVTWDTTFTNDYSETTGGRVPDRPVDFVQAFPVGTETRYLRINNMDHVGPAIGGDNYIGLGPVFIFESPEIPSLSLTGLQPDTTYRARIRTTDGEQTSEWFEQQSLFTTLPIAPTLEIGEVGQITNLTHTLQTVLLERTYENPVVFVQSPTSYGTDPVAVRVKDIQSDRFTIYLAEPSDQNGLHNAAETVTYVALEAGNHQLSTGTKLEVGTVSTNATVGQLINSQWKTVHFTTDFDTIPVLLSQVQTNTGTGYLQTRQNNISPASADLALEQEENATLPHGTETAGYLAIEEGLAAWNEMLIEAFNTPTQVTDEWYTHSLKRSYVSTPSLLASLTSYGGKDSSHVRYANLENSRVQFRIGEDTTRDSETLHSSESVAYLAIGGTGTLTAVTPQIQIGERGVVNDLTHVEQTIMFDHEYANPVVFAESPTSNGVDPVAVRIKNVQSDRFTVYLTEPSNQNGLHNTVETISYLVLEAGQHELTDGRQLEVGTISTNATVGRLLTNQWESVGFTSTFNTEIVVLSQIQTASGQSFLHTRQNNVQTTGFDIALEQEELITTQHETETVGYLALEAGTGTWSGMLLEAQNTPAIITDEWYHYPFHLAFPTTPRLLSSLTSYHGADNAHIRYTDLNNFEVQFRMGEDTTVDEETQHSPESIAYLTINGTGTLTANAATGPPQVLSFGKNVGPAEI